MLISWIREREWHLQQKRRGTRKDLQGAWGVLRDSVVKAAGFDGWDRVLFHIDEAMSWESVRSLNRMPPLLLIIRNLCAQGQAPKEVMENIDEVNDVLKEVLQEYHK